ncbi:MAG TPA: response regulator transcription factor [Lacunisphaera sp.]|nr:response regulator transcription factor [Lacunisphaera sp.]
MKVLLVEDHVVVRQMFAQAISFLPGFKVVGGAASLKSAVELMQKTSPDIIVLDINLSGSSGLELLELLREEKSQVRCLIFSGITSADILERALELGAKGIVEKTDTLDQLTEALTALAAGRTYLSPSVAKIVRHPEAHPGGETLNQREREVLMHIGKGHNTETIAIKLGISSQAVDEHRANLIRKTGLLSQAELTKLGVQLGLIQAS